MGTDVRWVDRLRADAVVAEADVTRTPWRYLGDLGAGVGELGVGGRRLEAEPAAVSLLLGTEDVRIHWRDAGGPREILLHTGSSGRTRLPLPATVELRRLRMCHSEADSGEEILFPLEAPPDETDYRELIELIESNAMPIAGICNRPRVNLRVDERAEVLRRTRRMTLRTAPYLARHPEDWEGQSLRMPYPRRLLTALPEDEWSTYENRMVRTVVRDAYGELGRREREVRATLRQLREALRISETWDDQIRRGDWPRAKRIWRLLRGNVSVDALRQRIDELQDQARRLEQAVGVLGAARHSPLFRMLGAVRDERELRPTNLMLHDTSYHAALVVRQRLNRLIEFQSERAVEDPLPVYFRWLRRALRHALLQVGFRRDGSETWLGQGWRLSVVEMPRTWTLEVACERMQRSPETERGAKGPQETLASRHGGRATPVGKPVPVPAPSARLVILPVWVELSDPKLREDLLAEVAARADGRRYLVVFPGAGGDTSSHRQGGEPNFPHLVEAASPARLESVEVLAREVVRETWFRDVAARRWPRRCAACENPHVEVGGGNKFECGTCGTEAALTQETCSACGREFTTPYILREDGSRAAGTVSQSDVLDVREERFCWGCRVGRDAALARATG